MDEFEQIVDPDADVRELELRDDTHKTLFDLLGEESLSVAELSRLKAGFEGEGLWRWQRTARLNRLAALADGVGRPAAANTTPSTRCTWRGRDDEDNVWACSNTRFRIGSTKCAWHIPCCTRAHPAGQRSVLQTAIEVPNADALCAMHYQAEHGCPPDTEVANEFVVPGVVFHNWGTLRHPLAPATDHDGADVRANHQRGFNVAMGRAPSFTRPTRAPALRSPALVLQRLVAAGRLKLARLVGAAPGRRETAAITIQAAVRGHQLRGRVPWLLRAAAQTRRTEAAILLSRVIRGYLAVQRTRRHVQRQWRAALAIQRAFRLWRYRSSRALADRLRAAATRLQRWYRVKRVRAVLRMLNTRTGARSAGMLREEAVYVIRHMVRTFLARRGVARAFHAQRRRRLAATILQSAWRAYTVRSRSGCAADRRRATLNGTWAIMALQGKARTLGSRAVATRERRRLLSAAATLNRYARGFLGRLAARRARGRVEAVWEWLAPSLPREHYYALLEAPPDYDVLFGERLRRRGEGKGVVPAGVASAGGGVTDRAGYGPPESRPGGQLDGEDGGASTPTDELASPPVPAADDAAKAATTTALPSGTSSSTAVTRGAPPTASSAKRTRAAAFAPSAASSRSSAPRGLQLVPSGDALTREAAAEDVDYCRFSLGLDALEAALKTADNGGSGMGGLPPRVFQRVFNACPAATQPLPHAMFNKLSGLFSVLLRPGVERVSYTAFLSLARRLRGPCVPHGVLLCPACTFIGPCEASPCRCRKYARAPPPPDGTTDLRSVLAAQLCECGHHSQRHTPALIAQLVEATTSASISTAISSGGAYPTGPYSASTLSSFGSASTGIGPEAYSAALEEARSASLSVAQRAELARRPQDRGGTLTRTLRLLESGAPPPLTGPQLWKHLPELPPLRDKPSMLPPSSSLTHSTDAVVKADKQMLMARMRVAAEEAAVTSRGAGSSSNGGRGGTNRTSTSSPISRGFDCVGGGGGSDGEGAAPLGMLGGIEPTIVGRVLPTGGVARIVPVGVAVVEAMGVLTRPPRRIDVDGQGVIAAQRVLTLPVVREALEALQGMVGTADIRASATRAAAVVQARRATTAAEAASKAIAEAAPHRHATMATKVAHAAGVCDEHDALTSAVSWGAVSLGRSGSGGGGGGGGGPPLTTIALSANGRPAPRSARSPGLAAVAKLGGGPALTAASTAAWGGGGGGASPLRRTSLDIPAAVTYAATASVLVPEEERVAALDTMRYLTLLAALAGVAAAQHPLLDIVADPNALVALCFAHARFLGRWWPDIVADVRAGRVDGGPGLLSPAQRDALSVALRPNPLRASLIEQLLGGLGMTVERAKCLARSGGSGTEESTASLVAAALQTTTFTSLGGAGMAGDGSKQRQQRLEKRRNDGFVHSPLGKLPLPTLKCDGKAGRLAPSTTGSGNEQSSRTAEASARLAVDYTRKQQQQPSQSTTTSGHGYDFTRYAF